MRLVAIDLFWFIYTFWRISISYSCCRFQIYKILSQELNVLIDKHNFCLSVLEKIEQYWMDWDEISHVGVQFYGGLHYVFRFLITCIWFGRGANNTLFWADFTNLTSSKPLKPHNRSRWSWRQIGLTTIFF